MNENESKRCLGFPQASRVVKPTDYLRIKQSGRRVSSEHFVFYIERNGLPASRLGLIVSKKVGNAVVRNRVKRLLREGFRRQFCDLSSGVDIVALAKPTSASVSYEQVVAALLGCSKRFSREVPS